MFKASLIGQVFSNSMMDLPEPNSIDNKNGPILFCMVPDEAFPLTEYIMRSYPGRGLNKICLDKRIFNYR